MQNGAEYRGGEFVRGFKSTERKWSLTGERNRSIARLKTFDVPRSHEFCRKYQVDKQALRNLLQSLKEKDLILEDPDFDEPWDVRKLDRVEFS